MLRSPRRWRIWTNCISADSDQRADALAVLAQSLARAARKRGLTRIGALDAREPYDARASRAARSLSRKSRRRVRIQARGVARGGQMLVKPRVAPWREGAAENAGMSDWTLCMDFGTAFSKAAAAPAGAWSRFDPAQVRPLMLSGHDPEANAFLLDSAVFIDDDRVLFGRAAIARAEELDDKKRMALRSFKTLLSVTDLDRALNTNAPARSIRIASSRCAT